MQHAQSLNIVNVFFGTRYGTSLDLDDRERNQVLTAALRRNWFAVSPRRLRAEWRTARWRDSSLASSIARGAPRSESGEGPPGAARTQRSRSAGAARSRASLGRMIFRAAPGTPSVIFTRGPPELLAAPTTTHKVVMGATERRLDLPAALVVAGTAVRSTRPQRSSRVSRSKRVSATRPLRDSANRW